MLREKPEWLDYVILKEGVFTWDKITFQQICYDYIQQKNVRYSEIGTIIR